MERKYELIPEDGMYRIKALRDFSLVKKGDLGGLIAKEKNLSHTGNAWVYDNAEVFGDAKVYGNAMIRDNATVFGNAKIYGDASVGSNVSVFGYAKVYGDASVLGDAHIYDNASIYDTATISGDINVSGNAKVFGHARLFDTADVRDDVEVFGNVQITAGACLRGDAKVKQTSDYIVFKNWWSSGRMFTWTRSNDKYAVGCFYGTGKELIEKAYKDSETSGREYERIVRYVEELKRTEGLEPVPLTTEILDKNGFVRIVDINNYVFWKLLNPYFVIEYGRVSSKDTEDYLYMWVGGSHVRLRYVHELQQALRLRGINKEIEL